MATTSVPWARPSAFGLVAPSPLLVSRRPGAPVRAFRRSDLDGFARRVASGEALRDAWRSANNGIEQVAFEARRAAERLERRYDLFRRFDSAARAAANWARKIDQELGIGRQWRSFSVDFSRNWPRVRRELNGFLQTPLGRSVAVSSLSLTFTNRKHYLRFLDYYQYVHDLDSSYPCLFPWGICYLFYILNTLFFVDYLLPLVCIIWVAVQIFHFSYMGVTICCSSSYWNTCQQLCYSAFTIQNKSYLGVVLHREHVQLVRGNSWAAATR
ncbi:unnamed protein product [Musa acuminata var. zebrina]